MLYHHWIYYLAAFVVLTILMQIGEASTTLLAANDVNASVGYQVDQIDSGGGFFGLVRTATTVLTELVPKAFTFNYTFLEGSFELIRWGLITIFAGAGLIMLGLSAIGLLQRNV